MNTISFEIEQQEVNGVVILRCKGRCTLSGGSAILRETLRELVGRDQKLVVLNLTETWYTDSSGIAELVSGFVSLSNQNGKLKLCSLSKQARDFLAMTKLYTVFEVFETEDEAVRSFTS